MQNNKDREMDRAPMKDALENGRGDQTAQPDAAPVESDRLNEMIESLDAEASPGVEPAEETQA
ncbi:MAG: hypothetical protein IJH25_09895, partial [Clostridia bacterium]|nr:hypothetical protein [Clostridia bacterium]